MISTVGVYLHRFDNSHKTTRHDEKRKFLLRESRDIGAYIYHYQLNFFFTL